MSAVREFELGVLVGVRVDPVSGRTGRSRADSAAVALAQKASADGAQPWLCTFGPMPDEVARDYLALGVDRLTRLVPRDDGLDAVSALAQACGERRLVLAGSRGEAGRRSGLLPYALARRLGRPLIGEVIDLRREPDGGWRVVQALPRGARHAWRLAPGAAAVLMTSPLLAQREDLPQRHSWVAARSGHLVDLPMSAPTTPSRPAVDWRFEPARKQRRPLAPVSIESGTARMARATGSAEAGGPAGVVVRDGMAREKAERLLEHLRKLALVQSCG